MAVLNEVARENGLGTSLIERLFNHYKKLHASKTHVTTLLTNYRSHPSILMLASSLLYECTLLSRSDSRTYPKYPFPIVFACTSLKQEGFGNLPAVNEREAELLIAKLLEFIKEIPDCNQTKPTIGLLASTRKQVRIILFLFPG